MVLKTLFTINTFTCWYKVLSFLKRYLIENCLSLSCLIHKAITPLSYGHHKGLHKLKYFDTNRERLKYKIRGRVKNYSKNGWVNNNGGIC